MNTFIAISYVVRYYASHSRTKKELRQMVIRELFYGYDGLALAHTIDL